ncbi:MAG: polyphosphate polymerase domain-containing protein [Acutalibacter sp.]
MALRHEWKHRIDTAGLLALRARLGAVLQRDPHALGGSYQVRSLYFDNLADKALREKLESVNHREKFRLRFYNGDLSLLVLEKKAKTNGLCGKAQTPLSVEEARALLEGRHQELGASSPLLGELRRKMDSQGLRPKAIVEYTREPFLYGPGNVRVTLDYNIRTALSPAGFLDPGCVTLPAADAPVILEVKWDEFLPDLVRDLVQLPGTRTSAFSKYAACRMYG